MIVRLCFSSILIGLLTLIPQKLFAVTRTIGQDDSIYIDAAGENTNEPLPESLKAIAARHLLEEETAPAWVNDIKEKTVASYFENSTGKLSPIGKEKLLADALRLHFYFEDSKNQPKEQNDFAQRLRKYILDLTRGELHRIPKEVDVAGPVGEWSVETLVVSKKVEYLAGKPNFFRRAMGLITGPHLRAVSKYGAMVALTSITGYGLYHFQLLTSAKATWAAGALAGLLWFELRAGPGAVVTNALFGWFLTPTTEGLRVLNNRYLGPVEERINNFYDRWKPAKSDEDTGNKRPRIANLKVDGMNFADMSANDQENNWNTAMRWWVAVAKRFGQLLRDTHHSGRFLMMISWTDETAAAALVETMASKLVALDVRTETILTPHKTAFLINREFDKKTELEETVNEYKRLCTELWANLQLSEAEISRLEDQIDVLRRDLADLGLSKNDLAVLADVELTRANAVGSLVTAVALNEMRAFFVAEANRNLPDEARKAQRATRFGLNLQKYVEDYQPLVQHQITLMGFQHSSAPTTKRGTISCGPLLKVLAAFTQPQNNVASKQRRTPW